jgi:PqqD family protein of HPr-rel-A system
VFTSKTAYRLLRRSYPHRIPQLLRMSVNKKWRLSPRARLHWRVWGEECVIFNGESGDTHMLDSVAGYGLSCFEKSPHDLESLSLAVGERFGMEPGPLLRDYIERLVSKLSHLGLIEIDNPDIEQSLSN